MIRRLLTLLREQFRRRPEPPPEPDEANSSTISAVALILLSGLRPEEAALRADPLLTRLGVTPQATRAAADLLVPHVHVPSTLPDTPALQFIAQREVVYQAAYLIEAARRLTVNPDVDAERVNLARHLNAARARRESAERVDQQAIRWGPVLGWYALNDGRTTAECRSAGGHNFSAFAPPRIGYPGSLHGGACRCVPGPPHRGGRLVDEVVGATV